MKKMKYFLGFIMMTAVIFITNSCTESVPTYTNDIPQGCQDVARTHMNILVCDVTQTNYFGGVEVFMYLTDADRTNDPQRTQYSQHAFTDNTDPINKGAMFYKTPFQKYFFFARKDLGGGNFLTGTQDSYPTWCTTKNVVVVVSQ